jgi:hypothetical protein
MAPRSTVTVTLEGGDNLTRTLEGAARDLGDLSPAHRRAADLVAQAARARAPRRSGRLASTIQGRGDREGAAVVVGAVYAGVQEYGWAARRIPAQPYLNPAAEATTTAWTGEYQAEVQDILGTVKGV